MYVVVVDAYRYDIAGHYNLTLNCYPEGDPVCLGSKVGFVETTLGDAFSMEDAEWTFIEKDSDIARIYQETFNDRKNISLENVRVEGGKTITTKIYLGIGNQTIATEMIIEESNGATASSSTFGQITYIECGH